MGIEKQWVQLVLSEECTYIPNIVVAHWPPAGNKSLQKGHNYVTTARQKNDVNRLWWQWISKNAGALKWTIPSQPPLRLLCGWTQDRLTHQGIASSDILQPLQDLREAGVIGVYEPYGRRGRIGLLCRDYITSAQTTTQQHWTDPDCALQLCVV